MRWYTAISSRGKRATVHAMDHQGAPACGRLVNTYTWRRVDLDATCAPCLARIAAAAALGPAGLAASRILRAS